MAFDSHFSPFLLDKASPQRLEEKCTLYIVLQPGVMPRRDWDTSHTPNSEARRKIQILFLLLFSWANIRKALFVLGKEREHV
jgi:hypothetical protein